MKSTQATPEQLDRLARIVLESGLQGNEIPYLEKRLADMDIDCLIEGKRRFPDGILRGPDYPVLLPVHSAIPIAPEQMNRLFALVRQNGWGGTALDAFMEEVLPGQLPVGAEAPRIVTSVTVPLDYSLSFADLLAAGDYAEVMLPINEDNFPIKVRENGEHEFLVVSVKLQDDEDPAKSKLLWDLDRYGLQPEGAFELHGGQTLSRSLFSRGPGATLARPEWRSCLPHATRLWARVRWPARHHPSENREHLPFISSGLPQGVQVGLRSARNAGGSATVDRHSRGLFQHTF